MHKIIYHQSQNNGRKTDCPDGIAAAWVVRRHLLLRDIPKEEIKLIGCDYQSKVPAINEGDIVFIVDFSFKPDNLKQIESVAEEVTLIDHHKPSIKEIDTFRDSILKTKLHLDMYESGATLAWKLLFGPPMPLWLQYVRDRDLWEKKMFETEEVFEGMSTLRSSCKSKEKVFALFDEWTADNNTFLRSVLDVGRPLMIPKRNKIAAMARTAVVKSFRFPNGEEYRIPVVTVTKDARLISDVGSYLYKEMYPEYPFILFIQELKDKTKYQLRSDQRFDVQVLADACGGGGLPGAAGFVVERYF